MEGKFMDYIERGLSPLTSYGLGVVGVLSPQNVMFALGALALVLRILYDGLKFYRYWKDPNHKG